MSRVDATETETPQILCEFCGLPIDDNEQCCPALDDGRCRP